MERLSGLDAMFLYIETPTAHMHVTGVYLLEAGRGGLGYDAVRELLGRRLPPAGPLRRRLVDVPLGLHHPLWVEDPDFDLDYHIRRVSLPAPGGQEELADLAAEISSRALERSRPLWELHVVEGLEGGRVGLVGKVHHAAVDGVSGAELMTTLLDLEPEPSEQEVVDTWRPEQVPPSAALVAGALAARAVQVPRAFKTAFDVFEKAIQLSKQNRAAVLPPPPALFGAPRTSLNRAITAQRRVAFSTLRLEDLKAVRRRFSCTVNDVVLALCAGALRSYLCDRSELPRDPIVALVPRSVRSDGERGSHGNRVSAVLTSLATHIEDPVGRLAAVTEAMGRAKSQEEMIGSTMVREVSELGMPAVIAGVARLVSQMHAFDRLRPAFNVTISNVAGPSFPLFLAGARVVGLYPLGPVGEGAGLNITVISYCGTLYIGLNACRKTVPDPSDLSWRISRSLEELLTAANRRALA